MSWYMPTCSVFVPERDRPGTKTEIIIVKIIVKVNSEEDTFSTIGCSSKILFILLSSLTHTDWTADNSCTAHPIREQKNRDNSWKTTPSPSLRSSLTDAHRYISYRNQPQSLSKSTRLKSHGI